jgi:hypothetical protein
LILSFKCNLLFGASVRIKQIFFLNFNFTCNISSNSQAYKIGRKWEGATSDSLLWYLGISTEKALGWGEELKREKTCTGWERFDFNNKIPHKPACLKISYSVSLRKWVVFFFFNQHDSSKLEKYFLDSSFICIASLSVD